MGGPENCLFCVVFLDGKRNIFLVLFCPSQLGELIWMRRKRYLQCRSLINLRKVFKYRSESKVGCFD